MALSYLEPVSQLPPLSTSPIPPWKRAKKKKRGYITLSGSDSAEWWEKPSTSNFPPTFVEFKPSDCQYSTGGVKSTCRIHSFVVENIVLVLASLLSTRYCHNRSRSLLLSAARSFAQDQVRLRRILAVKNYRTTPGCIRLHIVANGSFLATARGTFNCFALRCFALRFVFADPGHTKSLLVFSSWWWWCPQAVPAWANSIAPKHRLSLTSILASTSPFAVTWSCFSDFVTQYEDRSDPN